MLRCIIYNYSEFSNLKLLLVSLRCISSCFGVFRRVLSKLVNTQKTPKYAETRLNMSVAQNLPRATFQYLLQKLNIN